MKKLRTVTSGWYPTSDLCDELIVASKWFEFTPLPDDEYEFIVKDEPGLPKRYKWEEIG